MGARPTTFAVAIAMGPANAYVDISSYLEATEDFTYTWGRTSAFDDTDASEFSFPVTNAYGCFTPNNVPTYVTPGTLGATTAVGASSFQYATALPAGSFVVLDAGASAELVVTGTPTGAGPYTIPVAYPMAFAHTSGVQVAAALPLTEGMGVCWQLNTRLVSGTIQGIEPDFPSAESSWAQVRITADDMLGTAARATFTTLLESMILGSGAYLYYPLDDAVGSVSAAELSGNSAPTLICALGAAPTFGITALPQVGLQQMQMSGASPSQMIARNAFPTVQYPTNSMGAWGLWATPLTLDSQFFLVGGPTSYQFTLGTSEIIGGSAPYVYAFFISGNNLVSTVPVTPGVSHWIEVVQTASGSSVAAACYIDDVLIGTITYGTFPTGATANALKQTYEVFLQNGGLVANNAADGFQFSSLFHGPAYIPATYAGVTTEANRLAAIAIAAGVTLSAPPATLSTAPVGVAATSGQSGLDAFNDVMRTEAGYITTQTTGSLTSPSQSIVVRARDRPLTVTQTYDLEADLTGAPEFARDVTHTVQAVNGTGIGTSASASDPTLASRVGGANTALNTVLSSSLDVYGAASDLLNRGRNLALVVTNAIVDLLTTSTNRWASILGQVAGDRIELTDIPSRQLGFTVWDGWYIGASETHTVSESQVEMRLDPCTPKYAIFDTDLWANGGNNTLSAAINASVTTMVCVSADGITGFETAALNYYVQVDSEVMQVTGCTALSGGTQTLTVARGQNSTIAAPHAASAIPEVAANPSDVPTNSVFAY